MSRGALVRIKNNSNSVLTRTELKLEYSNQKWSKLPPGISSLEKFVKISKETIRPNSAIEFGTQNHNVLSGTSGSVIYKYFHHFPLCLLAFVERRMEVP